MKYFIIISSIFFSSSSITSSINDVELSFWKCDKEVIYGNMTNYKYCSIVSDYLLANRFDNDFKSFVNWKKNQD